MSSGGRTKNLMEAVKVMKDEQGGESPQANNVFGRKWGPKKGTDDEGGSGDMVVAVAEPADDSSSPAKAKASPFGGRWKKTVPVIAAASAIASPIEFAAPAMKTDVVAYAVGPTASSAKKDEVDLRRQAEARQLMEALEQYSALAKSSKLPTIPHPLAGKGSRMVFQAMSGVQKKAMETLAQEAYEGVTEPWMLVVNKKGSGASGSDQDAYSQPPNPLVPTGIIGKCQTQASGGLNHTILCTNTGEVFAMGENRYGQLGVLKTAGDSKERAKALAFLKEAYGDSSGSMDEETKNLQQQADEQKNEVSPTPVHVRHLQGRRVFHVNCGSNYSAVLTDAGEIFTWGCNENGQLGVGDFKNRDQPCIVESLKATQHKAGVVVVNLDCGADHMACISFSNEVYTWGLGNFGNLGHGTTHSFHTPRLVDALQKEGIKQLSCGTRHTMALNAQGEVLTWGYGGDGRLGHGDSCGRATPTLVELLKGKDGLAIMVSISAGDCHSCAIQDDGTVYTWGSGSYYKLGHGDITDRQSPRPVKQLGGKRIVQVDCGFYHTGALTSNGVLYTWGGGIYGKLGHGNGDNVGFPQMVKGLAGKRIRNVNMSPLFTCVTTETGELWTCGYGTKGALGHVEQMHLDVPQRVETLGGKRVSMLTVLEQEMKARMAQMEGGKTNADKGEDAVNRAVDISNGNAVQFLACGAFHNLVATEQGNALAWGSGANSKLGFGDDVDVTIPSKIGSNLSRKLISIVGCGESHSIAVTGDGNEVYAWGNEGHGRLGLGKPDMIDPDSPAGDVQQPSLVEALKGQRVTELAVGAAHNIAATETLQVFTWGQGAFGRLGHGHCNDVYTPKAVRSLDGKKEPDNPMLIKKVAAGAKHSMIIIAVKGMLTKEWENQVLSWGSGWWFKLGHGNQENQLDPKQIKGLNDKRIVEIAAGSFHSAAVSSIGDVYTWGYGAHGRLGHDDYHNQEEPRVVKALRGVDRKFVVKISCGDAHTVAVTDNGKLLAWGKGKYGQLGTGDTNETQRPVCLPTVDSDIFVTVVCAANHTMAMTSTNEVYTWGMGGSGRLGHGDLGDILRPKCVLELSAVRKREVMKSLEDQDAAAADREEDFIGDSISLSVLQQMAEAESGDTEDLVKADADQIRQMKRDIDVEKYRNASLEREIRTVDKKIKLLVKNKKIVQNRFRKHLLNAQGSPISSLKEDYENLFYLLQSEPHYVASLCSSAPDEHIFLTQLLTCMYGNEADPREELLLLKYFEDAIANEFKKADRVASALGGVSAMVTTIMSFIRREGCQKALKNIIGTPLSTLLNDAGDFELNVLKVYEEVCSANNILPDPSTTQDQALRDPEIMNNLTQRAQVLRDYSKTFLDAIVDGISVIPYGIRYICKCLLKECKQTFPAAEHSQLTALVGGLIFMRWFLPAITLPEMVKMAANEILPRTRRHLVMVSKVLHNLVNGHKFTDKEPYMHNINGWLNDNIARMQDFLTRVADVEELHNYRKKEQYAIFLKQDNLQIRIAVNQCFKTHQLLFNCLAAVAPTMDDPMRVILRDVGVAPMLVPAAQNKGVNLRLVNRFDAPLSNENEGSGSMEAIMEDTRWQLTRILRAMAPISVLQQKYNMDKTNLMAVMSKAKLEAAAQENFRVSDMIKVFLARLKQLAVKQVYTHSKLLADTAVDLRDRNINRARAAQEKQTLQASLDSIRGRRTYLLSAVSAYREGLLSARSVTFNPTQVQVGSLGSCCGRPTMYREFRMGPHRYSYVMLERQGFILKSELPQQFRPHLTFVFESTTPGVVRVSVVAKQQASAGMAERDASIFNSLILIEDLVEAKEKKVVELNLRELVLDITQLLEIVNHHFVE